MLWLRRGKRSSALCPIQRLIGGIISLLVTALVMNAFGTTAAPATHSFQSCAALNRSGFKPQLSIAASTDLIFGMRSLL